MSAFSHSNYDAVVVGSGPNGLAAAIALARCGRSVLVLEAESDIGGGTRSAALTLPGFIHDVCSAVHPLAAASPFLSELPLLSHGLHWIQPESPLAHPLDDGSAVLLERSVSATASGLGADSVAYQRLMEPLVADWPALRDELLRPWRIPRHPLALARFGLSGIRSAIGFARKHFQGESARALFAGLAAHSLLALEEPATAAFGLMLGITGHAVGWPIPQGGSQQIANALAFYLQSLGGEIVTGHRVESIDDLPPARLVLCDLTPRGLVKIAGHKLPPHFVRKLSRYRYGMGVFKMDFALNGPIPWRAPECARAATVHLGGTLAEIAASERAVAQGRVSERPFVLLAQPSLFDPTRAPEGKQTSWAYCHVPNSSTLDMRVPIVNQIERFAPGFRDRILATHVLTPTMFEQHNANLIGGDINGGVQDLRQMFLRPTARLYATPLRNLYLCSSSTPPGGGVHGMCGYFAAITAMKRDR